MENKEKPNPAETPKAAEPPFLAQYRKAYPQNKKFYVTSDNQVFLEREYKQAQAHQRTTGKGELAIY